MKTTAWTSTALALLFGLGVALTGSPAAAQQSMAAEICDRNEDGFIDSQESYVCGDARFDELSEGSEYIAGETFMSTYSLADDPEGLFGEIDADRDEQISREEWRGWGEAGFAEATADTEGRMEVGDYDRWQQGEAID